MTSNDNVRTLTPASRQFVRLDLAKPIPHPDGGVFHILPMTQLELNRLAKKMVKINYVADARGRTIFNPDGEPVPRLDKSDEEILDMAVAKCQRVTAIAVPVYVGGEPVMETVDGEEAIRTVPVEVDASDVECGADHAALEGRCTTIVAAHKGKPSRRCAVVRVGDFVELSSVMLYSILAGAYVIEIDAPTPKIEEPPAVSDAESTGDLAKVAAEAAERDAEDVAKAPPAAPKKKVWQLVGEWVLDQSSELGHAKARAALGN